MAPHGPTRRLHGLGGAGTPTSAPAAPRPLPAGSTPSLEALNLEVNQVGGAGCAALVAALSRGAMPLLRHIGLGGNRASDAARAAVGAALTSRGM